MNERFHDRGRPRPGAVGFASPGANAFARERASRSPGPAPAPRCLIPREWRVLGCVLGTTLATAAPERIRFAQVASEALERTLPVSVVVPAEVPATGDSPMLLFLHGRGRTHRSLIDSDAARAALLAANFFIVLPQGEDGWYIDSPARPADRYGSYLAEVVGWAEANLPVSRRAARRGIGGWSMGGYGAVRFAQTHRDKFDFVASVIGLLDFPRPATLPEGQNYRVPVERFTADPVIWRTFNPLEGAAALREQAITLVLATRGFERTMNENFLAALARERIAARVHWLDGGHEFSVVERALPLVFADAAAYFAGKEVAGGKEPR